MKVSIITTSWNSEDTILDTITSVNDQAYANIEHIVVDGGSIDGTLALISQHGNRVREIISEDDDGVYDAMNKGLSMATGDIIGFLNSDDVLASKDVISNIVQEFKRTGADAVYGDLEYVSRLNLNKNIRFWRAGFANRKRMLNGWMPPHPTFYIKRELPDRFGGFDLNYKISADYDAIIRYLFANGARAEYLSKTLVLMRVGGLSNKSLSNIFQKTVEDYRILSSHGLNPLRGIVGKNIRKIPQFFLKRPPLN
jgi:glycosyltransferase